MKSIVESVHFMKIGDYDVTIWHAERSGYEYDAGFTQNLLTQALELSDRPAGELATQLLELDDDIDEVEVLTGNGSGVRLLRSWG